MKKIFSLVVLAVALALTAFNYPGELPIGSPMPKANMQMEDVRGKKINPSRCKKSEWFVGNV